ncbi:MAG TPA: hypothetical protein VH120_05280 [Gemmataceae bacterium]|jgi:hypothetical protein|nr:hypothetical protein [Gemmataceae bacterium]
MPTTADPTRLRYGPYRPPRLKQGERADCLFRGPDVVVTGRTAARISWPLCRSLGNCGGGTGLLMTQELRRAVVSETAAAIKFWFGVGTKAVWQWRRAFGVSRLGTPGSRALRTELNRELADRLRGVALTPAACERRRRTANRLDLGRHLLNARWAETGWTEEQVALLGTRPDAELAKRFGRTTSAVRQRRTKLGIPTYRDRRRTK